MKRTSVEEGSPPKRSRLEDNLALFDETRRKNATDLLDPATDETNNIEAKIHMVFPCIGNKRQVNVEMREHSDTYRFLVIISSKVDELMPFPFAVNDRICLSLKGAQIQPRAQSSAPFYLPVRIIFKDGIAAMLMSGPEIGKVFSTWEGDFLCCFMLICADATFLVDWYSATGDIPRIGDIVQQHSTEDVEMSNTNPPSKSPQPEIVASQKAREEPMPVLASRQHLDSRATSLPQPGARSPEMDFTRGQRRRRKRQAQKSSAFKARRESDGHEIATPQAEVVVPRPQSSPPTNVRSPPQVSSNERISSGSEQTSSSSKRVAPVSVTMPSPPPANDPAHNHGPLTMKAGMTTQGVSFVSLEKFSKSSFEICL